MGERFDVLGDRDIAGLDGDLLDAEADVDHLALFSLYHDHSNERVLPGEMISNHRPKVVFWINMVQHLVIVMRKTPSWRARDGTLPALSSVSHCVCCGPANGPEVFDGASS